MTNSYNDIHNSKLIFLIGGNPAEAHPVSLLHLLKAKEQNSAPFIVCDPRFTRTAAHADEYVRIRPGTDIAVIWGMLWHIFENGWEDKEYHPPARLRHGPGPRRGREVDAGGGRAGHRRARRAAQARGRADGQEQARHGDLVHGRHPAHHRQQQCPRLLHPAAGLGNMGVAGGGTNIFRGHDNVQGATDMGVSM